MKFQPNPFRVRHTPTKIVYECVFRLLMRAYVRATEYVCVYVCVYVYVMTPNRQCV